ncbi:MAG: hypothetical protein HXX15_18990 [Rhodopseudomonas sp.]|uniref:hypothetical protein n=1 Tax=Rhodopseudomonas sp. TaxID=1078 RepID=UPI0017F30187|nr:hypothetical protein [Rhodopseudomonas sp.]NVN88172.1 hypothetical protein [Rhodopseudomonas sp.]
MSALRVNQLLRFRARLVFVAAASVAMLNVPHSAWPQTAPAAAPSLQPAQPAAPREENPGLVNEIGKLLKNPSLLLPDISMPHLSNEQPEPRPSADARPPESPLPPTTPPPETPSRLGVPSMVTGRVVCSVSAGGGPDCKAAADTLCKAKGFSEGKSLGADAVEKCSAKVLIPGRPRQPGDCRTDNFVTSAWCQ